MPESPPPGVAPDAVVASAQALTPDAVAAVLADFRQWLTDLSAPAVDEAIATSLRPEETIDLHTLLGQFLAVRQEVNLQTRAVRAQQEQNAETLRQLSTALDSLGQSQARAEQYQQRAAEETLRPLLTTLIDLYDALAIAGREMQRTHETVRDTLEQFSAATDEEAPTSWLATLRQSLFGRTRKTDPRAAQARENGERIRQMLASLVAGYTMSLQRVERALRQHGLEAIATAGERFDPERMEVVEAVAQSGRPAGEVLDEIRRGYLWNGRVFRYAQVRVAKS
jgi:molecular chaperone GrpE